MEAVSLLFKSKLGEQRIGLPYVVGYICYGLLIFMCRTHVCVPVRMYSYVLERQKSFTHTKLI